ncbi:hypothetical protein [Modestobacter sp. VKM Ac-2978]|nr:hypothetical protein [Modestobacter sp. VKM Ac-2978]MCZ2848547.1 hypothetical protein [Modestobacter sp. VKM Ac-2978]
MPLDELTSATLERLATDPVLRATAGEVAAEIATMPDPSEVVGDLEALVR